MANDALKALHTALLDARRGYEEAVEDSEKPELTALFRDMIALRDRHHAELHAMLGASGETPDDSGSFMGTVHKAAVGVRAAITGLNENALSAFASGEERIIDDYDDAIAEAGGDAARVDTLTRQKKDVTEKIAAMKRIAGT